jgi:hypothetical protein
VSDTIRENLILTIMTGKGVEDLTVLDNLIENIVSFTENGISSIILPRTWCCPGPKKLAPVQPLST